MQSKLFAFVLATCTIVPVGASVYAQSRAGHATAPDVSQAEYQDQQFNFSLQYPAGMTVSEDSGDGGSETIFFVDATSGKQFELRQSPTPRSISPEMPQRPIHRRLHQIRAARSQT